MRLFCAAGAVRSALGEVEWGSQDHPQRVKARGAFRVGRGGMGKASDTRFLLASFPVLASNKTFCFPCHVRDP